MAGVVLIAVSMWIWQVVNDSVDVKAWFLALPIPAKVGAYVTVAYCIIIFNSETPQSFIYFRF